MYGVSDATVCAVLRRSGVKARGYGGRGSKRKYNLTTSQSNRMVQMYKAGSSCEVIAAEIGVPWLVVNKRLKELGVQLRPAGFQTGENHHGWNGGESTHPNGYVYVRVYEDNPFFCMANEKVKNASYVLKHRLVMAQELGRPLTPDETVHHIDGDRSNNDISNLQLRQGKHGKGVRMCCADCGSTNVVPTGLAH